MSFDLSRVGRARHRVLLAGLLAFVAACGGPAATEDRVDSRLPAESGRVFATAFDQVQDKYVRNIQLGSLVDDGLSAVMRLDPGLRLQRNATGIEIVTANASEKIEGPARDDARGWARVTVSAIDAARFRSAVLRDKPAEEIYQAFFDGALRKLDPYSRYNSQESAREARAQREGFGGIGITIDTEGGDVRITSVMDESPAAIAGLKMDDRITAIEGENTHGLTARDIVKRLRGPIGQPVAIEIARGGVGVALPFTLVRALIVPQTVTYRRDGEIAQIRVASFNHRTTEALVDALRRAERETGPRITGIILDLRGNLGGLLDQSVSVADLFIAEGRIVSTRGRHRSSGQDSYARRGDVGERVPMVVLMNGNSASASEIVAAALQDHNRAVVIGTTSFGKGSVQTVVTLPNEGELVLTWARFHAPSGYALAELGVRPTVCTSGGAESVPLLVEKIRAGGVLAPDLVRRWHEVLPEDTEARRTLRTSCPPESTERESDVALARALLADRTLYGAALAGSATLATARGQSLDR